MRTDTPTPPATNGQAELFVESPFDRWIAEARAGSPAAIGRLLESTRKYLLLSANQALDPKLKVKVAPSDLVQETFVHAHRDFARFRGDNQQSLLAWLTVILAHRLSSSVRQYKTRKRTSNREVSIEADDAQAEQIADSADTPRTAAAASEERARVQTALERLTPRYREILIERTFQRLTFAEIGKQRGCSADAARKLWGRAVARLQEALRGIP